MIRLAGDAGGWAPWQVFVLLAVALLLLGGFLTMTQTMAPGGPARDWLHRRDARRWSQPGAAPATVTRHYWTIDEYRKDSARLREIGHRVESETTNDPYVVPIVTRSGRPLRRYRVPIVHVIYTLPAGLAAG
ncbi:MAG TPA: hypothetical protein VG245_09085 [Candidatus Dormibacteraeota bacterium]|nr:hypothetical protein [Candidatus Dormibacteraeota bacterium]